jgi:hypothetical protein
MYQVIADRVPPVLTRVFRWITLVEHVPLTVPIAQSIGVVQAVLRTAKMVTRVMGIF